MSSARGCSYVGCPYEGCQAAVAGRPVVTVACWRVGSSSHSLALSGC